MDTVVIRLELMADGSVQCKSSVTDIGMVLLVLEKAKMEILQNVKLEKATSILTPRDLN